MLKLKSYIISITTYNTSEPFDKFQFVVCFNTTHTKNTL